TIGPALYLATGGAAVRRVLAFTLGVLAVYFIGGVVLTLGPGQAILRLFPHPSRHATHLIELCVGIALAFVAVALWLARQLIAATRSLAADGGRRALERVRLALDRRAALLIPVLILAVALVIASIGTIGLAGGLD